MRLDRNINDDGKGKYALVKIRQQPGPIPFKCHQAVETLEAAGLVDFGRTPDSEFFVIKLRDKYAAPALVSYANAAMADDPEYANDVLVLALRAQDHPGKKKPD